MDLRAHLPNGRFDQVLRQVKTQGRQALRGDELGRTKGALLPATLGQQGKQQRRLCCDLGSSPTD